MGQTTSCRPKGNKILKVNILKSNSHSNDIFTYGTGCCVQHTASFKLGNGCLFV